MTCSYASNLCINQESCENLPISNRSRRRWRSGFTHRLFRRIRRLLLIIKKKLLTHRITQLKCRQSVTQLRNLIITKPKS
ncbi:hypothetical protein HanPSC8_Chr07g0270871 [Helianthus annuus]|nr:hypothetical protein HanPSC8_Chr07g0270871 [Helianthus annuus]